MWPPGEWGGLTGFGGKAWADPDAAGAHGLNGSSFRTQSGEQGINNDKTQTSMCVELKCTGNKPKHTDQSLKAVKLEEKGVVLVK